MILCEFSQNLLDGSVFCLALLYVYPASLVRIHQECQMILIMQYAPFGQILTMPLHGKDHWNEMAFLKLPITRILAFGFGPAYFNRNCLCLVTSPKLQKLLNIDPLSSWEILAWHLYLQFMSHPHFIFLACLVLPRWLIKSFPWFLRLFVIFLAHSFSFLTVFPFYHLLYYHHVHLLSHQPSLTLLHQYLPVHLLRHPLSLYPYFNNIHLFTYWATLSL